MPYLACTDIGLPDNGLCLLSVSCSSDADCSHRPGTTCTETKDGPYCLSGAYPLGSFAP